VALAAAWVVFPLLLAAVASGWGLLVEWAAGARLPAPLLPGVGLCALAAALTLTSATIPDLALAATACGALAGLALRVLSPAAPGGEGARSERGAAFAALIAFALLAAPVVLSGAPAVSGYIRLDDSATFLALGDWMLAHGRDTAGLAPSTFEATVQRNLSIGYPVGAVLPAAAAGRLTGVDLAWAWAPYLAVIGSLLALATVVLVRPLVTGTAARVGVAVLSACSALLLGFVLWGGIKEVWTAASVALLAALVPWTLARLDERREVAATLRALVPAAVACAGLVSALSIAGLVWAAPALGTACVALAVARRRERRALIGLTVLVVGAVGLAVAALGLFGGTFVSEISSARAHDPEWLGNLLEPLRLAQVGGIWPARDFRVDPVSGAATTLLLAALAAAAAYGLWRAARERAWGLLAYGGVLAAALLVLAASDWAWAEAKALAIASPVPLALAGAGAGSLLAGAGGRRAAGLALGAALAVGVGWSYALAFQGTTLSPFDRHDELARIGERFAGRGPALATEFDTYSGRWFLRRLDAEVAGELRRRTIPLSDGGTAGKGESVDIDRISLEALEPYRLLVLRRSPAGSRPSSAFERVWRGRWYEVWQRRGGSTVVERLALGGPVDATAVPACADVRRLARAAGADGSVLAATAPSPAVGGFAAVDAPGGWQATGAGVVYPAGDGTGTLRATAFAPSAGRYEVWVGGEFRGAADVAVDGVPVGRDRHQLGFPGNWVPFGTADLSAGPHAVSVRLDGGGVHPGVHGITRFGLGPVALVPADAARRIVRVRPSAAGALCGRRLDWIEAVR